MSCRTCKSYPNCDGCNINTLIKALYEGRFDFDEHHNVIIPDKVIHAKWKLLENDCAYDNMFTYECSNCLGELCMVSDNLAPYCPNCNAKMDL